MKKNVFVRVLAVLLTLGMLAALTVSFASCGGNDGWEFEEIETEYKGTTLYVYNWGEYISDGSEGSLDVVKAFEKVYGIKVKYDFFSTNEELYASLNSGKEWTPNPGVEADDDYLNRIRRTVSNKLNYAYSVLGMDYFKLLLE